MFTLDPMHNTSKKLYSLNVHTSAKAALRSSELKKANEHFKFFVGVALDMIGRILIKTREFVHVVKEIMPPVETRSDIQLLRHAFAWNFLVLVRSDRYVLEDPRLSEKTAIYGSDSARF